MTAYEQMKERLRAKQAERQAKKAIERQAFLDTVDVAIISKDAWSPSIKYVTNTPKGYVEYRITRYPTGALLYDLTWYDFNLDIYRESQYFHSTIPRAHSAQFAELERMFI